VNKLVINECKFTNSSLGIFMEGVNHTVSIKDNFFEELNDNPIRIYGYEPNEEATDNILITGNEMYVKRVTSYINDTQAPRFDDGRVNFPTDQPSKDERSNLTGISAINIAMTPLGASDLNHENVVVADNIAFGSDYGFYDGGSADLFSLKDIVRLKCYGNTARNSGDLGFAIERCHTGVVSNNTADRNNSCGISIFDSSNISVTGNVCSNNELVRDGAYTNNPYGGIRVEQNGHGVIVEGNFCNADSDVVRSYVNYLADNDSDYNTPSAATQRYGVVVKNQGGGVPFDVKVGNNHATGMLFGSVFNNVKSAQIVDTYSRNIPPTKGDYPLGARLRNNLISSSTAATKEWYVSQRIQLKVVEDVLNPTITTTIKVSTLNTSISDGGVDVTYKIYENNDLTTIQSGDIIGIMQDNYSIHWTTVTSVDTAASTISFQDVLTDTITVANQIQRTVVSLRWEAL
jgi:parallel beta-helix repeat protein